MPDTLPTRLQIASANRQAQYMTSLAVHARSSDAQAALDDAVRALGKLLDVTGKTDRMHDIIGLLSDEASDLSHGFVREMDDVGLWHDGLDLTDMQFLLGRVG